MKLTVSQIQLIARKSSERQHAIDRLAELRQTSGNFESAKVIFERVGSRSFVEHDTITSDLAKKLRDAIDLHFKETIARCDHELAQMGVEISGAA